MDIRLIMADVDHNEVLARLEFIFDAHPDSKEGAEAKTSTLLIDNYEYEFYSIDSPDSITVLKIRMVESNLKQRNLVDIIGWKGRVSEILNKKKRLTVDMIRKFEEILHVSASILVQNYKLSN